MKNIKMPFANDKIKRQTYIYERLLNASKAKQRMGITQLAKECGVSTKTISRDLHDSLSQMGAIKVGKGWLLDEKLAKDSLQSQEKITLSVLDNLAKSVGEIFYHKAHNLLESISSQFASLLSKRDSTKPSQAQKQAKMLKIYQIFSIFACFCACFLARFCKTPCKFFTKTLC